MPTKWSELEMLLWEEEDPPRNVPIEGTDRPWKTLTLRQ